MNQIIPASSLPHQSPPTVSHGHTQTERRVLAWPTNRPIGFGPGPSSPGSFLSVPLLPPRCSSRQLHVPAPGPWHLLLPVGWGRNALLHCLMAPSLHSVLLKHHLGRNAFPEPLSNTAAPSFSLYPGLFPMALIMT